MLPLDTVNSDGVFKFASVPWFSQALQLLVVSGAYGVALDVWWGAVEKDPKQYNWSGYKQVIELLKQTGLKVQVVLSFHACGGNVGDTAQIPLPEWVLQCGDADPDLFFTDRPRNGGLGQRNREYVSIWADDAPGVLRGRSPLQCYEDFMAAFRDAFYQDLGQTIEEVVVGTGPCGELRLPSYVEANGWRFPGAGEFQCYDRRALASLAQAAREAGHAEWGYTGPHDAGHYNSTPEQTGFFCHTGSWDTPYGRFFLEWYSTCLLRHGDRLLTIANSVFISKLQLMPGAAAVAAAAAMPPPATPPLSHLPPRPSCLSSQMLDRILETTAYELAPSATWPAPVELLQGLGSGALSGPASGTQQRMQAGPGYAALLRHAAEGGLLTQHSSGSLQAAAAGSGSVSAARAAPAPAVRSPVAAAAMAVVAAATVAAATVDAPAVLSSVDVMMDVERSDVSHTSVMMDAPQFVGSGVGSSGSSSLMLGHLGSTTGGGGATPLDGVKFRISTSAIGGMVMEGGGSVPSLSGRSGGIMALAAAGPFAGISMGAASGAGVVHGNTGAGASSSSAAGSGSGSGGSTIASAFIHAGTGSTGGSFMLAAGSAGSGVAPRVDLLASHSSLSAGGGPPYLDMAALSGPEGDDMSEVCTSFNDNYDELFMGVPAGSGARSMISEFGGGGGGGGGTPPGGGGGGAGTGLVMTSGGSSTDEGSAGRSSADLSSNEDAGMGPAAAAAATAAAAVAAATSTYLPSGAASPGCIKLVLKIAGIHWWYRSRSHAAELTAGYYNTQQRDGYAAIVDMCARHRANLVLTCVEMCDAQHPVTAQCGPEGLLRQLRTLAARAGVCLSGENALPIFSTDGVNAVALDRIVNNSRPLWGPRPPDTAAGPPPSSGGMLSAAQQQQLMQLRQLSGSGPAFLAGSAGGNNIVNAAGCRLSDAGRPLSAATSLASQPCSPSGQGLPLPGAQPLLASGGSSGGMLQPAVPMGYLLPQHQQQQYVYQQQPAQASREGPGDQVQVLPPLRSFTFLRLGPELLHPQHQGTWMKFMSKMQHALT